MSAGRNGVWSVVQAAMPMLSNAAMVVVIARVLPLDQFGVYTYATTLVSLGVSVVTAGLSTIIVRELVARPQDQPRTLAGLTAVRTAFAVFAYLLLFLISLTAGASISVAATLIAGVALFVRAADTPDIWYQSAYRARLPATVRSVNSIVWLAVKFVVAFVAPSLWLFLALFVLEFLAATIVMYYRFSKLDVTPRMAWGGFKEAFSLLRISWPLIVSGLGAQLNSRADIPLVQAMLGSGPQAIYSAAVKISEVSYFLPNAFMQGTFPAFVKAREAYGSGSREYKVLFQRSLDRAFWAGALVSACLLLLSSFIIGVLFGPDFVDSAKILAIHSLACPFVFMSAVGSKWLIAENKLYASAWRNWAGAALNITLNLALLPTYGVAAAAVVAVVSYSFSSYFSFLCIRSTFSFGWQMTLAIFWPARLLVEFGKRFGGSSS